MSIDTPFLTYRGWKVHYLMKVYLQENPLLRCSSEALFPLIIVSLASSISVLGQSSTYLSVVTII